MRLCVIAHSAVHLRQQAYYRELARQGADVRVVCPAAWGEHRAAPIKEPGYEVVPLNPVEAEGGMATFRLPARKVVTDFKPHWVYVQNEPFHAVAHDAMRWAREAGANFAVYTWENNDWIVTEKAREVLGATDLVVCGNTEAKMLCYPFATMDFLTDLQVGVEPDLFPFWPQWQRRHDLLFVSRLDDPMKGAGIVGALMKWYPEWTVLIPHERGRLPYEQMSLRYRMAKILLTPSIELPGQPREQGPAYTNLEAMFCGTPVVTTDTASIDEWLHDAPVERVCIEEVQNPERPEEVSQGPFEEPITRLLAGERVPAERAVAARFWAETRFSNAAVAKRLLDALEAAT